MKAVAMARLALSLDPKSPATLAVLTQLQGGGAAPPQALSMPSSAPEAPGVSGIVPLVRHHSGSDAKEQVALLESNPPSAKSSIPATADVLPRIPLFSDISPEAFRSILAESLVTTFKPGEVIFRKGDPSKSLCVVIEGSVDVWLDESAAPQSRIGAGEFFGEMGVFTGKLRGATVKAAEPTEILEVELGAIASIVRGDPATLRVLLRFFGERLMANVLSRAPLFSTLPPEERADLKACFMVIDVKKNARIIEQGSRSEALFVLIDGVVVVERGQGEATSLVARLLPGEMFGEISVLTQLPAVATVRAEDRCLLLALPAARVHEVSARHPALLAHATKLASERMSALAPKQDLEVIELLGT
jgi:cAMP-dependent protein kinase regulator